MFILCFFKYDLNKFLKNLIKKNTNPLCLIHVKLFYLKNNLKKKQIEPFTQIIFEIF